MYVTIWIFQYQHIPSEFMFGRTWLLLKIFIFNTVGERQ
jgi:hypothetical protein